MKFKLNYTIDGYDDSLIVEGETIEEIKRKANHELVQKRGLDQEKNNFWSEQID